MEYTKTLAARKILSHKVGVDDVLELDPLMSKVHCKPNDFSSLYVLCNLKVLIVRLCEGCLNEVCLAHKGTELV